MLERLRFSPELSRGRRYPEPDHPYRGLFDRDRDRIVHSRAFRRLQDKTQVFTAPLSDHFRTRLTHTIEVAQIARTVAHALGLNETLTEALALAHDLGHPPFGHAGEQALDEEMRRHGERFDHNIHSLRVVDSFEQRYPDFPGLNLSFEVREGLLKHSRDFPAGEHPELAEYLLERKPVLEAQLIDPADEIAYNCADLDDAVEAKLIDAGQVGREIEPFGRLMRDAERRLHSADGWMVFNDALRKLADLLVSALIHGVREAAEDAGAENSGDVCHAPVRLGRLPAEAQTLSTDLKRLLAREVYHSAQLERDAMQAAEKIRSLFRRFLDDPDLMPRTYREQARSGAAPRAVCDYIAGMTDKYLLRRYDEIAARS